MLSSGSGSPDAWPSEPDCAGTWADRAVGSGVVTVVLMLLSVRRRAIRAPESWLRVW